MRILLSIMLLYGDLSVSFSGEIRVVEGGFIFGNLNNTENSATVSGNYNYKRGKGQIRLWPSCGAYTWLASFSLVGTGGCWRIEQDGSDRSVPVRLITAEIIPEGG